MKRMVEPLEVRDVPLTGRISERRCLRQRKVEAAAGHGGDPAPARSGPIDVVRCVQEGIRFGLDFESTNCEVESWRAASTRDHDITTSHRFGNFIVCVP
jgi:hypothetical protein